MTTFTAEKPGNVKKVHWHSLCQTSVVCVASCFLIWLVSCPRFMSLLVNSVPGVCVWLWVYYHVYLSPVCWVPCRLVYSLFPVFLCVCIALSYLDVVIKDYYFEVSPRLHVPHFSLLCAPWQKTRPNSKRRPFTSFCVRFFKCFLCSWVLSLAASPHARRSREFMPPFAALPSRGSREFTLPFAAQRSRCSWELTPPFAAQPSRHSRINQPTVHGSTSPQFTGDDATVHG